MRTAPARVTAEDELAALDANRRVPSGPILNRFGGFDEHTATVVCDEAGLAVCADNHPRENGTVAVKLVIAVRYAHQQTARFVVKERHVPYVVDALQRLTAELLRLRLGGWHLTLKGSSDHHVQVYNPLSPDQQHTIRLWSWSKRGTARRLRRAARKLQAVESTPLRRCGVDLTARLQAAAEYPLADVDLTGLVQARYPSATGVELAGLIAAAYDAYSAGASASRAVAEAAARRPLTSTRSISTLATSQA